MSICIVKNPKSYVILAKYIQPLTEERNGKIKIIKAGYWKKLQMRDRIPLEVEDIRFRRAVIALEFGYKLYPDTNKPLEQVASIDISEQLISECVKEYNTNPFVGEFSLDTREFFETRMHREPTKKELELLKQQQIKETKQKKWAMMKHELAIEFPNLVAI